VGLLPESVAGSIASDPEIDVSGEKQGARPHDLCAADVLPSPQDTTRRPIAAAESVLDLCQRLERDHKAPAGEQGAMEVHQRMGRSKQICAEHVGVDHDRRRAGGHASARYDVEEVGLLFVSEIIEHWPLRSRPWFGVGKLRVYGQLQVSATLWVE